MDRAIRVDLAIRVGDACSRRQRNEWGRTAPSP